MSSYFESKEEEWLKTKWGIFSASEMSKLLVNGKGGNMFGVGAMTYIKRIAREASTIYNEESRGYSSFAMKNGKVKEPESFQHLYKLLGFDGLEYLGGGEPVFKHLDPDSGCSPDCLAIKPDGTVSFGCELKNPNGDTHFGYLIDDEDRISDMWDLKKKKIDYYTQCQFSMKCYNTDLWLWISYNEYFDFRHRMLIIEVKRDNNFLNELDARRLMAIKKKYELIEQLKQRA